MSTLQRIALVFTVIGAVNWGLIGFFQFDLVAAIFGGTETQLLHVLFTASLVFLGLSTSAYYLNHPRILVLTQKHMKFNSQYVFFASDIRI